MLVTVEFLGLARRLAGQNEVRLDIHDKATLRDVVAALGKLYPTMLHQVIAPETCDLISPYFFNVGGRLPATSLETPADQREPLILMCLEAGG